VLVLVLVYIYMAEPSDNLKDSPNEDTPIRSE